VLKKTFTYQDLDNNSVTEDWYFNLNLGEIAEMALSYGGDAAKFLQNIVDSKDPLKIIGAFKDIIGKSVGLRSEDNKSFLKGPEITQRFFGTDAYSSLLLSMVTDANAGADFINNVLPPDLIKKAAALQASNQALPAPVDDAYRKPMTIDQFSVAELEAMSIEDLQLLENGDLYFKPGTIRPVEDYSREELLSMPQDKFDLVAGTDSRKWSKQLLVISMQRRVNQK
jgi:hypothetical protein